MIQWNDSYSTGVSELDSQHRVLFQYINRLEDANKAENVDAAEVGFILKFLENYCKSHFSQEERCMAERKCPVAAKNLDAHKKFLEFFGQIKDRHNREGATRQLVKDVYEASSAWLTNHICGIDINLRGTSASN